MGATGTGAGRATLTGAASGTSYRSIDPATIAKTTNDGESVGPTSTDLWRRPAHWSRVGDPATIAKTTNDGESVGPTLTDLWRRQAHWSRVGEKESMCANTISARRRLSENGFFRKF